VIDMGKALRLFFQQKSTMVGILVLAFFQLTFGIVWLNGYDGVMDKTEQLPVAVVNEDGELGKTVAEQLVQSLPFAMREVRSLDEAKAGLESRELKMAIHIPADFTKQARTPDGKVSLAVLVSESNPAMVKTFAQQVLGQVTAKVNQMVTTQGVQAALTNLKVPPQQAAGMAAGLTGKVEGKYEGIHRVANFAHGMIPMMLVLASYVGAMLLSLQLNTSAAALQTQLSAWARFGARQVINLASTAVVSLIVVLMLLAFGLDPVGGYAALFGFVWLSLLAFVSLAQLFVYLIGDAGMLLNIIALSLQLVTSGVLVPRELLGDGFRMVSDWLPATYVATGNLNLLFGGSGTGDAVGKLFAVLGAALAATVLTVAVRAVREKKVLETKVVA
jgi:YhgE/Pip-like protein